MNLKKVLLAVYTHRLDQVENVLNKGWNPNLPGPNGENFLHEAALVGSVDIVKALLGAGANVNARADDGDTTLILAVTSAALGDRPQEEVESVEDLGEVERLQWSASRGNALATVQALIAGGADVNSVGADGLTPLLVAIQQGSREVVATLLEAGADPTVRADDRLTALGLAQRGRYKNPEIVQLIQDRLPAQLGLDGLTVENDESAVASKSRRRPG